MAELSRVVIVLVAVCGVSSTAWAQDDKTPATIKIRIKAERYVEITQRIVTAGKNASVFGAELIQPCVRIDKNTKGLAEVFVWTRRAEADAIRRKSAKNEPVFHDFEVKNGNFWPRAIVAEAGDILRFRNNLSVAVHVHVDAPGEGGFSRTFPTGAKQEFTLLWQGDRIDDIFCSIHPWMHANIFVMRRTHCRVTDELGECELPIAAAGDDPIEVHLWHPSLGKLKLAKAVNGVEEIDDGRIRVSPDVDEIEVIVQVEERQDF